jgi:hypothetical protein
MMSYADGTHVTLGKLQTLRRRIKEAVDMATRRDEKGWLHVSPPPSFGLYGNMVLRPEDAASKEEVCDFFEWCWRIGQDPKHGTTAATFEVAFLAAMLWKHAHAPGDWKKERDKQRTTWNDDSPRSPLTPGEEKACQEDIDAMLLEEERKQTGQRPPGDRQADPQHPG